MRIPTLQSLSLEAAARLFTHFRVNDPSDTYQHKIDARYTYLDEIKEAITREGSLGNLTAVTRFLAPTIASELRLVAETSYLTALNNLPREARSGNLANLDSDQLEQLFEKHPVAITINELLVHNAIPEPITTALCTTDQLALANVLWRGLIREEDIQPILDNAQKGSYQTIKIARAVNLIANELSKPLGVSAHHLKALLASLAIQSDPGEVVSTLETFNSIAFENAAIDEFMLEQIIPVISQGGINAVVGNKSLYILTSPQFHQTDIPPTQLKRILEALGKGGHHTACANRLLLTMTDQQYRHATLSETQFDQIIELLNSSNDYDPIRAITVAESYLKQQ